MYNIPPQASFTANHVERAMHETLALHDVYWAVVQTKGLGHARLIQSVGSIQVALAKLYASILSRTLPDRHGKLSFDARCCPSFVALRPYRVHEAFVASAMTLRTARSCARVTRSSYLCYSERIHRASSASSSPTVCVIPLRSSGTASRASKMASSLFLSEGRLLRCLRSAHVF